MHVNKTNKGFTLIELLIVVAIIGILAAVGASLIPRVLENTKRTTADALCHQIIGEIKTLWTGCSLGVPLHLVNDWGNLDTSTDWCTHTYNNFTIVQEWESHFANVYRNPYFPNEKGDLKKALRETCSRPDDLKPGCVRITSHAYNREDYWHFTCYNLDANDNLVTYQEKMIGRKQP